MLPGFDSDRGSIIVSIGLRIELGMGFGGWPVGESSDFIEKSLDGKSGKQKGASHFTLKSILFYSVVKYGSNS